MSSTPLAAFLELRARLLYRRLLTRTGVPELVARIVVFGVSGVAAVLFSGAVAAGTWRAARHGQGISAGLSAYGVFFGIWQAWTAVALTLAERDTLDLRRFLVYPLPPGRVYAYGLAASAAGDPFALFWSVMLLGAFVGAAVGRPGAWLAAFALVILLFVVATVAYIAVLQELLGRLVRIRRAREIAIALAYLALVAGIAWAASGPRRPLRELLVHGARLQWIGWPAALAAGAARELFAGRVMAAAAPITGLAVAAAGAGWLAFRFALADALSGGEGVRDGGSARARGLPVGWLGRPLDALVEKEWQYVLRHPLSLVMLIVIPAIAALVAWKAVPGIREEAGEVVAALPMFGFALYAHVVTQPFWLNGFGWDRGGARLLFLAPVSVEDVLRAKNLAAWTLSVAIFAGCLGAIVAVAGFPPAWVILASVTLHAGLTPWLYAAGNVVTAANPIGAGFTLERGSRLPMLSGLVGMGITSVVASGFAGPVLLALRLDNAWLLPPAWLGLGAVGVLAYQRTLPAVSRITVRRREQILDAVCVEDE